MGQTQDFSSLFADIQPEFDFGIPLVHNDHDTFLIRIYKSRSQQLCPVGRDCNPPGTWQNKFREMADIVI